MPSLLKKVKTKLSIEAHQKVRGLLEGQYGSVFKGRSLDFEDLREYIPGDDIKDIDWKATARSGQTRIRRYVSVRKHNILLVVDTGRNMAATAASGDTKKDVAILTCGIIGSIAQKHGDLVAMVAGNAETNIYMPLKATDAHLERILKYIDDTAQHDAPPSNITQQLEYIARSIRRRMMVIVVADEITFTPKLERLIRRLRVQHEILWVTIADVDFADPSIENKPYYDTTDDSLLPPFLFHNSRVLHEFTEQTKERQQYTAQRLKRLQITSQVIRSQNDTIRSLIELLEKQKRARR